MMEDGKDPDVLQRIGQDILSEACRFYGRFTVLPHTADTALVLFDGALLGVPGVDRDTAHPPHLRRIRRREDTHDAALRAHVPPAGRDGRDDRPGRAAPHRRTQPGAALLRRSRDRIHRPRGQSGGTARHPQRRLRGQRQAVPDRERRTTRRPGVLPGHLRRQRKTAEVAGRPLGHDLHGQAQARSAGSADGTVHTEDARGPGTQDRAECSVPG